MPYIFTEGKEEGSAEWGLGRPVQWSSTTSTAVYIAMTMVIHYKSRKIMC